MRFHLLIFIQMVETSLRLKSYRSLLIFWTLCVSLLLSSFILNYHYPSKFFPWWSKPSGKVPKTIREDFLWWLPSRMTCQETNVRESTPFLTENRQLPLPYGYCRQLKVFLSFSPTHQERCFLSVAPPSRKVQTFPVSCIPSTFPVGCSKPRF